MNLAGESIAGRRWSDAQKQRILDSRVEATRSLVAALRAGTTPPPVFVSGSAVASVEDELALEAVLSKSMENQDFWRFETGQPAARL